MRKLALALFLFGITSRTSAYPTFIGMGYSSCSSCHTNALGNGPLTDYGRAIGAVEVSSNLFREKAADETLVAESRFLGPFGDLPPWLRLSADYRGMFVARNLQESALARWVHMQAEASAVVSIDDTRLRFAGTLGVAPPTTSKREAQLISREHYAAYQFFPDFTVYAGLMDHAFGIRVAEHNAYLRERTLTSQNDQTHGVMLHAQSENLEGALHFVLGNLYQDESLRQKGVTATLEFETAPHVRLGASGLATSSTYRSRKMGALHLRAGIPKGHSLLLEGGIAHEENRTGQKKTGCFLFAQPSIRVSRGLYLLFTFEHFTDDFTTAGARLYRMGPSLQFFPMQRVELRADLQTTRILGLPGVDADSVTLLSQVHLWL